MSATKNTFKSEVGTDLTINQIGNNLKKDLVNCPYYKEDKKAGRKFENICKNILEFSISHCHQPWKIYSQSTTWDGHQRIDILVENYPYDQKSDFWEFIKKNFGAETIIFECKNKKDGIEKEEILQTKDYEIIEVGKFRIIFTRNGLSSSGINALRHWRNTLFGGYLILVLDQQDLINLIETREQGKDPGIFFYEILTKVKRKINFTEKPDIDYC